MAASCTQGGLIWLEGVSSNVSRPCVPASQDRGVQRGVRSGRSVQSRGRPAQRRRSAECRDNTPTFVLISLIRAGKGLEQEPMLSNGRWNIDTVDDGKRYGSHSGNGLKKTIQEIAVNLTRWQPVHASGGGCTNGPQYLVERSSWKFVSPWSMPRVAFRLGQYHSHPPG